MSFEQKLAQIDELQERIGSYGQLADEMLKKINYKFRLEWNYTSNSMEGNSLTKSETRSVMTGNITVNGKPIKDVLEVKGHDEVISTIMKMGKGGLNLSERRIKEIHAGIMHEEDPEKKAQIGQWKKENNYLYNYKNERFDFVAPEEVTERMHLLINWLNTEKEKIARNDKGALHPVALALQFNLDYISIHPFYDGNGRTSRILTNLILIAYGYPPLYIKENERAIYYQYLGDIQGYGGAPDVFYEYMAGLIIRSQELVLDAIAGKSIEEPDDIDKDITLYIKGLPAESVPGIQKSDDVIYDLWEHSIHPLLQRFVEKHKLFEPLFASMRIVTYANDTSLSGMEYIENIMQRDYTQNTTIHALTDVYQIQLLLAFNAFKRSGMNMFNYQTRISFLFYPYKWEINYCSNKRIERTYDQQLSEDEITAIVRDTIKEMQTTIDIQINRQ